jgi:hypothetical protein
MLHSLIKQYNTHIIASSSYRLQLIDAIQHLINTDVAQLINVLYHLDIDEYKISTVAQQQILEASFFADLIIERLIKNISTKQNIHFNTPPMPDADSW